jgi:hypothetical protein
MPEFNITCSRCEAVVTHTCDADFKKAVVDLLSWVPGSFWSSEDMAEAFRAESERQGDTYDFEERPFFGSQA